MRMNERNLLLWRESSDIDTVDMICCLVLIIPRFAVDLVWDRRLYRFLKRAVSTYDLLLEIHVACCCLIAQITLKEKT